MSWFRRKNAAADQDVEEPVDEVEVASAPAPDPLEVGRRETGPFDVGEVEPDHDRIDLGAIQLPPRPGMELRLEMDSEGQRVLSATIQLAGSSLQIQAFAAPRSTGVWDDVRSEIAAQITKQGGTADEVPGSFGRELIARIPVQTADGRSGYQPSRFVGVDGPRWFLRGVFAGAAAHDNAAAEPLEEVLRSCVVVRGQEAMAPRDLLELRVPAQARRRETSEDTTSGDSGAESDPAAEDAAQPSRMQDLKPFDRGPEITERR